MNQKRYCRKRLWPVFIYSPDIRVADYENKIKNHQVIRSPVGVGTRHIEVQQLATSFSLYPYSVADHLLPGTRLTLTVSYFNTKLYQPSSLLQCRLVLKIFTTVHSSSVLGFYVVILRAI